MFNNMNRVAGILGKKLHEKFKIQGLDKEYSFESCGLVQWDGDFSRSLTMMDCYLVMLMTGELVIDESCENRAKKSND